MEDLTPISPEESELIDRYLSDQLSAEELAAFSSRLESDPSMMQKLREMKLLTTGINEAVLQNRLSDFHMAATGDKKPAQIKRMNPGTVWLAAASVVLIVITGIYFFVSGSTSDEKLFSRYYSPDPGLITSMGNAADVYVFQKAMVEYKSGNTIAALNSWQNLLKSDPQSDTLNYFIGSALLKLGNANEAIPYFQKVTQNPNSVFINDALWYLGLSLIHEGKQAEAIEILNKTQNEQKEALLKEFDKTRIP